MIEPGIYKNMDMNKYHADSALSRSDIVRLSLSPQYFKNHVDEDKPQYRFGRAFHGLVLEDVPVVVNSSDGRSKAGKEFQVTHPDALSSKDADTIQLMAEHVKPFFGDGQAEVSFFWEEMVEGLPVMSKCRPDWLQDNIIYDLKTTQRTLEDFHWEIVKYSYDVQHVWYLRGVGHHRPIITFRLIVVEKLPPYRARLFEIEYLDRAYAMVADSLALYKQCTESGVWILPTDTEVHLL